MSRPDGMMRPSIPPAMRPWPCALALLLNMLLMLSACTTDTPAEQEHNRSLSDEAIQRLESLGCLGFRPETAAHSDLAQAEVI